jgi:hypothetical protein
VDKISLLAIHTPVQSELNQFFTRLSNFLALHAPFDHLTIAGDFKYNMLGTECRRRYSRNILSYASPIHTSAPTFRRGSQTYTN